MKTIHLTPKQRVLRKYPDAQCHNMGGRCFVITFASARVRRESNWSRSPQAAWKAAALAAERAAEKEGA